MNPAELKAVVEYMESERGVEREVIIRAIELALESASEKTGVNESDLRIAIERNTFQMKAFRRLSDGSEIESTIVSEQELLFASMSVYIPPFTFNKSSLAATTFPNSSCHS